jgi:hypothetical protein
MAEKRKNKKYPTVAPHVNLKCGIAIRECLRYFFDETDKEVSEENWLVCRAFLRKLKGSICDVTLRKKKNNEGKMVKSDARGASLIGELVEEQKRDMAKQERGEL